MFSTTLAPKALRLALGAALLAAAAPLAAPAHTVTPSFGQSAVRGSASQIAAPTSWTFTTLDNQNDPTFNQLLGINNAGVISGYFGSGASGHPNKGYRLIPPYAPANYRNENFPNSAQTQVVAINNRHDTAGFWADANGNNFGFIQWNHVFTSYRNPHTGNGTVNQILGLNDRGIGVGFYTDGHGVNHGYAVNQATGQFRAIVPPGGGSVTATGINDAGDITGFVTSGSMSAGFLLKNGTFTLFDFPMSTITMPFGINVNDQIVGAYVDGGGATHGFLLSTPLRRAHWQSIDDPNGVGTTLVNGINDNDELVGFYGNCGPTTPSCHGFLATP